MLLRLIFLLSDNFGHFFFVKLNIICENLTIDCLMRRLLIGWTGIVRFPLLFFPYTSWRGLAGKRGRVGRERKNSYDRKSSLGFSWIHFFIVSPVSLLFFFYVDVHVYDHVREPRVHSYLYFANDRLKSKCFRPRKLFTAKRLLFFNFENSLLYCGSIASEECQGYGIGLFKHIFLQQ